MTSTFEWRALATGIFQSHIKYLLCLATAVEIVLLGVSFSGVYVVGM